MALHHLQLCPDDFGRLRGLFAVIVLSKRARLG